MVVPLSVHVHVSCNLTTNKPFITVLTLMWFKSCVCSFMPPARWWPEEAFITILARVTFNTCMSKFVFFVLQYLNQGRSQTSEQDEAIFERRRCEPVKGSGGMPPPRNFYNLEAQKSSCKHCQWYFSSQKSILGKCRSSLFYCLAILGQVNDHLHFKAF